MLNKIEPDPSLLLLEGSQVRVELLPVHNEQEALSTANAWPVNYMGDPWMRERGV